MITMSDVMCIDCGHSAADHTSGAGCYCHIGCECQRDPRQILLDRINRLEAAQHHAHLTPETQATSQTVINAETLEPSDGVPQSAQAQVA